MMIDPILSLSFNLHSQKGTYALILGSGISRNAGIPTGWEVTIDLVSKLAHLQGEDCGGDEAGWYKSKYTKEPDYSVLLAEIAPKPAAQQQLLKAYFEPTAEEREEGKKLPTKAHKAIAQLVVSGHLKAIVTTNFDRLLESALEAEGIAPVVIDSASKALGAPPLAHSKCTIIKVHGDYLDHRIKNTPEDLAKYEPEMDRLLDKVFDEYGVITCGWSSDYDTALRAALERSKSRRYPLYWTGRGEPTGHAKGLIALHGAHFVKIDGADEFFSDLVEKVAALDEFDRPHPISIQAAIVTLKKYLSEDRYRIQFRDFLIAEAIPASVAFDESFALGTKAAPTKATYGELQRRFEANCEKLIHLFANTTFYGQKEHGKPLFDAFDLIISNTHVSQGFKVWIEFKRYPALLLAYASGLAAVASGNYSAFRAIATEPIYIAHDENNGFPVPLWIHAQGVTETDSARLLMEGKEQRHAPLNDHLHEFLREFFRTLIPDDARYTRAFDDFEFLWCLLHVDARQDTNPGWIWMPPGSFCWRRWRKSDKWLRTEVKAAIETGHPLPLLRDGLFGGKSERLKAAFEIAEPWLSEVSTRWR